MHHGKQENSMTQYMKVHKGSHFDFPSVAQKLVALGDKKITKSYIGGKLALLYTVIAGDTFDKIVNKFKLPNVQKSENNNFLDGKKNFLNETNYLKILFEK